MPRSDRQRLIASPACPPPMTRVSIRRMTGYAEATAISTGTPLVSTS